MTGIQEGSEDVQTIDLNEPKEEPKAEPESKPVEPKAEEAKEPEAKDKGEEDDDSQDDDEPVSSSRSVKESRPLKAVFSQLKELRAELAQLRTTPAEKAVVKTINATVEEIAERRNLDAEGLTEIIELAKTQVMKDMEEKGLLKKDMDPTILEKLKVLDKIQEEQAEKAEQIHDEQEWMSVLPTLQKTYPNAPANLLADAKKTLLEIAHTKEFHDKDMDYVAFKAKDKLDAILKVAKAHKAGESASKEFTPEDSGEEEDIDLDPENITPEKMKRYQSKKYNLPKEDITIMGM